MLEEGKDMQRQYQANQNVQNKRLKKFGEIYSKFEDLVSFPLCSSLLRESEGLCGVGFTILGGGSRCNVPETRYSAER